MFAWAPTDMLGVDTSIICHRLSINPDVKPIKQKPRKINTERCQPFHEEVERLLQANFIRETYYLDWLAHPVLVKKKNSKWRICIDFTNLNQAFPKDSFLLPRINQLLDATAGYELLSFMNAYSDTARSRCILRTRTKRRSSLTQGTYCYKVISFGLKNAEATFQRMVKSSRNRSDIPWRYMSMICL